MKRNIIKIDIVTSVASYSKLRSSPLAMESIVADGILNQRQDKDKMIRSGIEF